jgi:hypothetical protein
MADGVSANLARRLAFRLARWTPPGGKIEFARGLLIRAHTSALKLAGAKKFSALKFPGDFVRSRLPILDALRS